MSRLANLIEERQTGRVKASPEAHQPRVAVIDQETVFDAQPSLGVLYEYRLGATFSTRGFAEDSKELAYIKDVTKRAIIEEVFGEFRQRICDIELAIARYEIEEARAHIHQLRLDMFS